MLEWAQEGNVSRLKIGILQLLMDSVIASTPTILSRNPVRAISDTLRPPKEKTMALGGVATGSMKAKEAASVQGSMT